MNKALRILKYFENKKNYTTLRNLCLRKFGRDRQEADEALNEIFVKLINNAEKAKFPEHDKEVPNFFSRALSNLVNDRWRKEKVRNIVATIEVDTLYHETDMPLEKLEALKDIIKSKARHFTEHQLALWKCIYQGQSIKEMQDELKKDANAIYKAKERLFTKIKKFVNEDDLY